MSADGKLTIAGTFDNLNIASAKGPIPENAVISFPPAYLVAVTVASLGDGLLHDMRVKMINGNGEQVGRELRFQITFAINRFGRPLRNNVILRLTGFPLPGVDDYTFCLYDGDSPTPLGEFVFHVTDTTGEPNG